MKERLSDFFSGVVMALAVIGVIAIAMSANRNARSVHAQASVVYRTQGDVTMNGSTALAIGTATARFVDVFPLSTNGGVVRCADSTASSSRGGPLAAGGGYRFQSPNQNLLVDLSTIFCYGANGDKVAVLMGAN